MVKRLVLIDVGPGETRIAQLEEGRLAEIAFVRAPADACAMEAKLGDVVLGRVKRILPGMNAAFVDIGAARAGFLSAKHATLGDGKSGCEADIRKLVHEGQNVIVQIVKDPIGEKGAGLSLSVSLPGRSLIFLPDQPGSALSRRIEVESDRERLTTLLEEIAAAESARASIPLGFIARTAALQTSEAQLRAEARVLVRRWQDVIAEAGRISPPAVLARETAMISAVLRDHVDDETEAVIINDRVAFAAAQDDAASLCPSLPQKLRFYRDPLPLFEAYGIEGEIEGLAAREARLPSGGWITFEETEALTAVDVNSGRFTARSQEETAVTTNLEAANEIGRQLRLRGIGGLIIVDFIHMDDPANIAAVEQALGAALARDRTPVQLTAMSVFGVIEITRKRVRKPVSRQMHVACDHCNGRGEITSSAAVATAALRVLARESEGRPAGRALVLHLAPDAACWLAAREKGVLAPLAARLCRGIAVEPDTALSRERYRIEELPQ